MMRTPHPPISSISPSPSSQKQQQYSSSVRRSPSQHNNNNNNTHKKKTSPYSSTARSNTSTNRDSSSGDDDDDSDIDVRFDDEYDGRKNNNNKYFSKKYNQESASAMESNMRMKLSKKAMKLVKKMEKLAFSKDVQRIIEDKRIVSSSEGEDDDDDFDDEDYDDDGDHDKEEEKENEHQEQQSEQLQKQRERRRRSSVFAAGNTAGQMMPRKQLLHKMKQEKASLQMKKKQQKQQHQQAGGLDLSSLMDVDPESTFSSQKLCREFTTTARLASSIVSATDDLIEIILEERSMNWSSSEVQADLRDSIETTEWVSEQISVLLDCATSFCGAADRVLNGAKEEVRTVHEEFYNMKSRGDNLHSEVEEKKSELERNLKAVEDLKAANAARALCLSGHRDLLETSMNSFSSSPLLSASSNSNDNVNVNNENNENDNKNNQKNEITNNNNNANQTPFGNIREMETEMNGMKNRLRVLLSTAALHVRGQKQAEGESTATGTNRVLSALDLLLNWL